MLFLPLLSEIKYDDLFFIKGPNFLESSPSGFSTLIISAPRSNNICVAKGPDSTFVKSKMNKDAEYKFTVPGIYAYWCTPHKSMGMIGFVVVDGDKSNLESIKALKFFGKSKKIAPDLINQL